MTTQRFNTSIFLFHRDLRLHDNTGLLEALKQSKQVLPIFILDEKQTGEKNRYRSQPALTFMIQSLKELNETLQTKNSQLYLFYGQTLTILDELITGQGIDAIYSNRDYTPFARKRDEAIKTLSDQHDIPFLIYDDALLTPPESVHKDDGKPYTIYTPFFRRASLLPIDKPRENAFKNYISKKIPGANLEHLKKIETKNDPTLILKGGRKEGLTLLKKIKALKNYKETRNLPFDDHGTSFLSAHHKFGTLSIRETYHAALHFLGMNDDTFTKELYWRDFFTHIGFHFPHVFGHAFHQKYDRIPWENDREKFDKWCVGQTGFPIVDAGMRQLNETGYMHNRLRMIVASFLTKDAHIDWRWGEQYFARQLIDYDPAVNNGSWQWAASTGCDAQPYFRIFNPQLQHKRYDPDSLFVKKWVPELKDLETKEMLKLYEKKTDVPGGYVEVMIDHKEAIKWAKEVYKMDLL